MVLMVWLLRANTAKPISYVGEKEVSCDRCPYVTLGSPLVSPGFAGYHVPADRRQRTARQGDAGTRLHDFGLERTAANRNRPRVIRSISTAHPQCRFLGCVSVHMGLLRNRTGAEKPASRRQIKAGGQ